MWSELQCTKKNMLFSFSFFLMSRDGSQKFSSEPSNERFI